MSVYGPGARRKGKGPTYLYPTSGYYACESPQAAHLEWRLEIFILKWEEDPPLLSHGIKLLNTGISMDTPKPIPCCQDRFFNQAIK